MLLKLLLWAVVGYIVYSWFRDKFTLKEGEGNNTTIHHHHYKEGKKRGKGDDEDYIEFEELKK